MAAEDIYVSAGFAARPSASSVRDVSAAEFIKGYAAHLKKTLKAPAWAEYVKTATGRELAPYDADWYFIRAASVARKVYLHGGIGVGALSRWYGKANAKGVKAKHHHDASRGLIRHILIALEKANILEKHADNRRYVSRTGQKDLDTIARAVGPKTA